MPNNDNPKRNPSRRRELEQQIKFALSNLPSRNAHHEFEDICRHTARARIASNILPATGPVSAGGDGGRDFETFRTYLHQEFGRSLFLSLLTNKVVVFACSTVAKNIPKKIRDDLKKICSKGTTVDDVHFFSNRPVTVAKRTELQIWVKQEFKVDLFIHDLNSLTEILADNDTFWIASEYLSIPQELFPDTSDPNWYESLKTFYDQKENIAVSFAEFADLKRGIRYATFHRKSDVSFWLSRLKQYPSISTASKISRMALYEICVASLRGLETLAGLDSDLEKYFEQIEQCDASELKDAQILQMYMVGADGCGVHEFGTDRLKKWRTVVVNKVETLLQNLPSLSDQAVLLQISGMCSTLTEELLPDPTLERSLERFEKLETLLDKLQLYPVDTLVAYLNTILELYGVNERLEALCRRIEALSAEREAEATLADRDWERARTYLGGGHYREAVTSLHRAASGYLSHEFLKEAVLSLMALAKVYDELGLTYAARHYAMCAFSFTYTARNNLDQTRLPEIAAMLANLEYRSGCWHSFLTRVRSFFIVYLNFLPNPDESLLNDDFSRSIVMHLGLLDHVVQRMVPEFALLMPLVESCGLPSSDIEKMREIVSGVWGTKSGQELKAAIADQIDDSPFCDGAPVRTIRWSQSGIVFQISFKNNYETAAAAEQFASSLQVLLFDLSSRDLYIIPGTLQIQFSMTESPEVITSQPDNTVCIFKVEFPKNFEADELAQSVLVSAVTVINGMSAIPTQTILDLFHSRMTEGLFQKLFFGSTYVSQFYNSLSREEYETETRKKILPVMSSSEMKTRLHELIKWDHSKVSEIENNEAMIQRRYDRCTKALKFTLARLRQYKPFVKTVETLKAKGWLDWHILTAVANLAVNYKVDRELGSKVEDPELYGKAMAKYFNREETIEDIVAPNELFTLEKIELLFQTSAMSTIPTIGLQLKSMTPQISSTLEFLNVKCGYREDVPHSDPWINQTS